MSGIKTVEELEKELHNTKSKLSYYKNRNKHRPKGRQKPSPTVRERNLAQQIAWNDEKRAMAHVIAKLTTTNDEDCQEARNQAYRMPIEDVRDLAKGHEKEVVEDIKRRQEKRKANEARRKEIPKSPNRIFIQSAKPKSPNRIFIQSAKPNYGSSTIQPEPDYTAGETSVEVIVKVKASTLRLAVAAVESNTGFDGLNKDQVVGHILSRYLQDNVQDE